MAKISDKKEYNRLAMREWRKNNPEKYRASVLRNYKNRDKEKTLLYSRSPQRKIAMRKYELKKQYGLTVEQYDILHEVQNGVCNICHNPDNKRKLSVDHNHLTGKVRGLLCRTCNLAIGNIKEDVQIAENIIIYLKKHTDYVKAE